MDENFIKIEKQNQNISMLCALLLYYVLFTFNAWKNIYSIETY